MPAKGWDYVVIDRSRACSRPDRQRPGVDRGGYPRPHRDLLPSERHLPHGTDPTAVVDPQLRVNGIEGLRVVDASIMPAALYACTRAPTIMIGEKGASMIAGSPRCIHHFR
jgi:hypothetical protein